MLAVGRKAERQQRTTSQWLSLLVVMAHSAAEAAFQISILVWAFDSAGASRAGSVALVGLAFAAVAASLASPMIRRIGAMQTYRFAGVAQALALAVLGAALALEVSAAPIIAVACLAYVALTLTRPAHYALLPTLIDDPRNLIRLTRDSRVAELVGIVTGPLLASAAFALSGAASAMAAAGICSGASLVCAARIDVPERSVDIGTIRELAGEPKPLLSQLRGEPGALAVIGLGLLHYIVIGTRGVLFITLAAQKSGSTSFAAIVTSCFSLGALTATLIGSRRLPPTVFPWMWGGAAAFAASMVLTAWTPNVVFACFAALAGAALATLETGNRTMLPRSLPSHVLGQVYAVQETMQMVGLAIGSIAAPLLIGTVGVGAACIFVGALPVVVVSGLRMRLQLLDRRGVERAEAVDVVARSTLFEGAPGSVVGALAFAMDRRAFDAGTVLVRKGDIGESLYLIVAGSADVSIDGRFIRAIGPGDYFGEVALLRGTTRTATIVAGEAGVLWELGSRPFLTAVTHASSDPRELATGRGLYADLA